KQGVDGNASPGLMPVLLFVLGYLNQVLIVTIDHGSIVGSDLIISVECLNSLIIDLRLSRARVEGDEDVYGLIRHWVVPLLWLAQWYLGTWIALSQRATGKRARADAGVPGLSCYYRAVMRQGQIGMRLFGVSRPGEAFGRGRV